METRRQLPYASRYKVNSSGRIQIIDKQEIKKELGRSPDDAESWAMGIAHLKDAQIPQDLPDLAVSRVSRSAYGRRSVLDFGRKR